MQSHGGSPEDGAAKGAVAKAASPHDDVTASRAVDDLPVPPRDADGEIAQGEARDPDPFDLVGDVLDGQFRVDSYAGDGDFSLVYRGHHLGVDAPVAIKCLNLPATLEDVLVEPFIETFREGAKLHYRLAQGNLHIAQAISFGTTLAPRTGKVIPYLVREWLEGRSLAADLAARREEGLGPRSLGDALRLLASAADGLAYAHAQGLVHHSVNPRNLFVVPTMRGKIIKVLDFGVAKALNESVGVDGAPGQGLRVLFPAYAAPEQLDRKYGAPCAATDVYALALVVYEVLAGRPVYPPAAVTSEILESLEPDKRPNARRLGLDLPGEVEAVLQRALAVEPSLRQGNVASFWRELARAAKRSGAPASDRSLFVRPAEGEAHAPVPGPHIVTSGGDVPFAPPQLAAIPEASDPFVSTKSDAAPRSSGMLGAIVEAGRAGSGWFPLALPAVLAVVALAVGIAAMLHGPAKIAKVPSKPAPAAHSAPTSALALGAPSTSSAAAPSAAPSASAAGTWSPPPAPTGHKSHFDRKEATQALADASQGLDTACAKSATPRGPGSVRLRFNNDGTVHRITMGPPYAQTATGSCVADRFRQVRVTPFDGPPTAFNYSFTTIPW